MSHAKMFVLSQWKFGDRPNNRKTRTLRPPPNVDYVQGFPGIPPNAPDRPQAAVRGTIELRLGSEAVKAKWVRIELRKVETLPGGGQANTFYDHVGQSPLNVWQAREDYELLQTQDFPFFIRIPESVPPSINLEKGASIHYELVASVSLKGKKGLLRRSTSVTLSTTAPVIIDKHELHSTWPIYAQPDTRHVAHDSLFLTVDRSHTCYGPGDRVTCTATLRSDNISTVVLRSFEFSLKETTVWRGNPHSKKGAPQVSIQVIGEEKQAVNATLYGGTQHKTELSCVIPSHHCVSTVTAARHIDVTYTLHVTAIMATGQPLMLTLPVIVTNWTRLISIEAIRRIGLAPSLSPGGTSQPNPAQSYASTVTQTSIQEFGRGDASAGQYGTWPARTAEFGVPSNEQRPHTFGQALGTRPGTSGSVRPSTGGSDASPAPASARGTTNTPATPTGRTWLSSEDEKRKLYEKAKANVERVQGVNTTSEEAKKTTVEVKKKSKTPWATSEEEKKKLYDRAQALARKTQARAALESGSPTTGKHTKNSSINSLSPSSIDGHARSNSSPQHSGAVTGTFGDSSRTTVLSPSNSIKPTTSFMSAEEEKTKLRYEEAKQAVAKSQPSAFTGNGPTVVPSQLLVAVQDAPPPGGFVAPGQLEQAFDEKDRLRRAYAEQDTAAGTSSGSSYLHNSTASGSGSSPPTLLAGPTGVPHVKLAHETGQQRLYDVQNSQTLAGPSTAGVSQPFPVPTNADTQAKSEKERLRQWYEQQDALATTLPLATASPTPSVTRIASASASVRLFTPPPSSDKYAVSEKERLQKWYEQQDALASGGGNPFSVGMSSSSGPQSNPVYRAASPPAEFINIASSMDEKERLRQWYERQDALARGEAPLSRSQSTASSAAPHNTTSTPRLPPMSPTMSTAPLRPLSTRPQPTQPVVPDDRRYLSAVEEKAELPARLNANGRAQAPSNSSPSRSPSVTLHRDPTIKEGKRSTINNHTPPTPPPLRPRPPADYIHETRREDERSRSLSVYDETDPVVLMDALAPLASPNPLSRSSGLPPVEMVYGHVPPPPPLPPKIPIA